MLSSARPHSVLSGCHLWHSHWDVCQPFGDTMRAQICHLSLRPPVTLSIFLCCLWGYVVCIVWYLSGSYKTNSAQLLVICRWSRLFIRGPRLPSPNFPRRRNTELQFWGPSNGRFTLVAPNLLSMFWFDQKTNPDMASGSTVHDVLREMRHRHLILNFLHYKHHIIFPPYKFGSLSLTDKLQDVGIQDLSVLHLRTSVLGGSSHRGRCLSSPKNSFAKVYCWAPSNTAGPSQFSHATGHFNFSRADGKPFTLFLFSWWMKAN